MAMRATPVSDPGPWKLFEGAPPQRRLIGVISEDFTRDVHLAVFGDFYDEEERRAYCEWLLGVLNSSADAQKHRERAKALDELVRLSEELGLYEQSRLNPLICRHDDSSWCNTECRAKALALKVIYTIGGKR